MSAKDVVTATIKQEHYALGMVMAVLQRLLGDIAERRAEPDFALFAAALYYIDDFPERCHHPKEDEYLFKALRGRTKRHNAVLDDLQAEHVSGAQMVGYLHQALTHYQGGAPEGLERFRAGVDAYAAMLRDHMHKEDALLAQASDDLTGEDWSRIAAAFDANDDPLFGKNRRSEFNMLFLRILNLLPSKMSMPLRRGGSE
jgi:branched-chain amino acid transport system ATP-binding protein